MEPRRSSALNENQQQRLIVTCQYVDRLLADSGALAAFDPHPMRSALDNYAAVLRRWALDRLDDIRTEWTAMTDALRADIDRRLGHSQATTIDRGEIEQDLQRLALTHAR